MTEPLACSLPAAQAARRAGATRAAIGKSVLRRQDVEGGIRLAFSGDARTAARVQGVVDAESRCCPFLDMKLERREGELELTVTGPPGARSTIALLFA